LWGDSFTELCLALLAAGRKLGAGRFTAQRGAGTQSRHMVSNIAMTITGNRAAASAYLLVLISSKAC
jgi:hypothetical protein